MKPYQRRQEAAYPYYKLATWDARAFTFRDGKTAFSSEDEARRYAAAPGKYRVSIVTEEGRHDMEPFTV